MLFDLSGKRRRFIQVIYAVLAVLFAITFVGFGIGSDATGGIFDAIGLGSNSGSSSSNPQLEEDFEKQEERLAANPRDREALLELSRLYAIDAATGITLDQETGTLDVSEEARARLEDSADAWQRYLATKPTEPDASAAITMVKQVYIPLGDAGGAAEAQEIYAEANPASNAYATLAQFRYFDGDIEGGDEAAKLALEEATGTTRETLAKQLEQIAKQAEQFKQAQKDLPDDAQGNPLENPFGNLGSTVGAASITP